MSAAADPEEIALFNTLAAEWWDPNGPMRALHDMNPLRLEFLCKEAAKQLGFDGDADKPLSGLKILDLGCGAGLLSEGLARLGATVTGIDAAENNIQAATRHAEESGLDINYRHVTAEVLVEEGASFDMVCALEIIEHVPDPKGFIGVVSSLVRDGGVAAMSTMNRNAKSYALAIVVAEYVARLAPRGTHDWKKFIKPSEMAAWMSETGLEMLALQGIGYNPVARHWFREKRPDVNYLAMARKG